MSRRDDGSFRCDKCDSVLPNESVHYAAFTIDFDPFKPGETRQLHWCRANGCNLLYVNPETIPYWFSSKGILPPPEVAQ